MASSSGLSPAAVSTANVMGTPAANSSLTPQASLMAALAGSGNMIPKGLYWTITFLTITIPTWLFTLFSASLTVTLSATTMCVESYEVLTVY